MADKRLSAEPLVEGLGRSSLPWRLGWEAKDPRMSQMLKECHRFASLFHSRKTWTQKRAQAQWSLWRPLFRLMFFRSFHCSFKSWIVMNSISTWWLVSLGFPLSHACCHLPHLHFHMLNWHLWSWRCIWHIVHFHFSHVSLASAVHM